MTKTRLSDKIGYISFWFNIASIFGLFLFFFSIIYFPEYRDNLTVHRNSNPSGILFSLLSLGAAIHWGYCMWFLLKYDRYSKSIFPLLFFNTLYAPIYFYRVKIKKRPLRNTIERPKNEVIIDKSISDDEFNELTRNNLIDVLKFWSSKENQLEYQENEPNADVSSELFTQWNDFYTPESETMKEVFNDKEQMLLREFDSVLNCYSEKLNGYIPDINEFTETKEWLELNSLAKKILIEL